MRLRRAGGHLVRLAIVVLLGGMLAGTLARMAPGFSVDERELDTRLNEDSLRAIRGARAGDASIVRFYLGYFRDLTHGRLGVSRSLNRPVEQLFAERLPVTARNAVFGLAAGWLLGFLAAGAAAGFRIPALDKLASALSGAFLCVPSAVLALLFLFIGGPVPVAIGFVVFPRVFRYCRNLFFAGYALPHVLMARAKGVSEPRVFAWHVLPAAMPPMIALAGVSLNMAFGAAIPLEVICDSPGIGQLAWKAALARDLPLLVSITMLITLMTMAANSVADLALASWQEEDLE